MWKVRLGYHSVTQGARGGVGGGELRRWPLGLAAATNLRKHLCSRPHIGERMVPANEMEELEGSRGRLRLLPGRLRRRQAVAVWDYGGSGGEQSILLRGNGGDERMRCNVGEAISCVLRRLDPILGFGEIVTSPYNSKVLRHLRDIHTEGSIEEVRSTQLVQEIAGMGSKTVPS
ncbi:hypothetical protein E2562_001533 [Oryza meyeriana var. granulata]|uniref:Uncharacterized protein n=1 Tax=Oryza meyeriana var. granulata TaxID=110450 RepID=A0A6G1DC39_9ORYZ|nr:hypothetical protein E2562_001533 [Oryza meyeriana var. granulata]